MRIRTLSALVLTCVLAGCTDSPAAPQPEGLALDVTVVADNLDHAWDVATGPDGTLLVTERRGRVLAIRDGQQRPVQADLGDLFASGETGLMAIALAHDFATSRKLFTCQGFQDGATRDVRVVSWTVDANWSQLTRTGTVLSGFPVSSGRHGGCRILPRPDGTLFVGTGDAAQPANPQDRNSLGGKVLHVNADGRPAPGNPDPASPIFSLGHRNVQGLAVRPGTDAVYGVEQGPTSDDEVNLLAAGANYGWKPDRSPGRYDESVPMTDPGRVPGAVGAVWSSGTPTLATASGAFLDGPQWGAWNGALAVGALKGKRVVLLKLSPDGRSVTEQATPPELADRFGRLRSIVAQPDGSLLVTTDNGNTDKVLRVAPLGRR